MVAAYRPDRAIEQIGSNAAVDPAWRTSYRNRVIAVYLIAIDAHYADFARSLSNSGKGLHIGLDGAVLLLTGAGAMFGKAASDLSAAATVAGGARGSVDRELFADKTLTLLISLMDSRRLAVRTDIVRGQSRPEDIYTLEDAFADLMRYESAGTIDAALTEVAAEAGAQAQETRYDYEKAKDLCVVSASTDKKRRELMLSLEAFERTAENPATSAAAAVAARTSLHTSAKALAVETQGVPADKDAAFALLASIRDLVEAQCSDKGVDDLRTAITTAGVTLP